MLTADLFYVDNQKLTRRPFSGDVSYKIRPITVLGKTETYVLEIYPKHCPDFTLASIVMDTKNTLELSQLLATTVANFSEGATPLDQLLLFPENGTKTSEVTHGE